MRNPYLLRWLTCLALLLCGWPKPVAAAPFTPGNIVVARVGDGTAPLNGDATAVFLVEYTPTGTLVQTIALPTSVTGNNRILTASGVATSELNLTRSADGRYLVLTGYGAAPGTTAVAGTSSMDVARVIGRIAADGSFDTSTSVGEAFSGVSIRAAASANGQGFYAVGANSAVQYVAFGGFAGVQLNTTPTNIRAVNVSNGNLYVSASSNPFIGLSQVGTGLPTTAGQSATLQVGTGAGSSPYGFYFADLSTDVAGADVVYVADDRTSATTGGVQKWSLVGSTWVLNGTIGGSSTAALRGLNGQTVGTSVSLAAAGNGGLYVFTDNAGYNAAPSPATLPSARVTAPASTAFRGAAFAPVTPAPTIVSFTPTSGATGTTVTVTGTDFTGATAVTLNGAAVTGFTVVSATSITFAVPAGATSGLIAVTTPSGTATSATAFTVIVPNPMPSIASLSPASVAASSGAFTLTITGTGFLTSSTLTFNGTALPLVYTSGTQVAVSLPAGLAAGTYPIVITNPTPGGGASAPFNFTVTPIPAITSLSPNTAVAGSASFTLTVTGTSFASGSEVNFNGTALATTFVSATQLTAAVPASAVATVGTFNVTVINPVNSSSAAASFTVTTPAPTITAFSPASGQAGDVVTIAGTDFTGATAVTLNGAAVTGFTVVSATSITFAVPAGATSGLIAVTTPSGTATSATAFTVIVPNPVPSIASLAPATAVAGSTGFTLTVNGAGFVTASEVSFNGVALATTFVSATQLTAAVPASALATAGAYSVTVTNPAPGGGTSAGATFTVTVPAPTIVSFTPSSSLPGATVTVTGTDFTGATAVTLNGAAVTGFTVVSATSITFAVPAGATSGLIAVTTPSGTATSATAFTVIVPNPMPSIASLSPNTAVAGSAGFTLTVNGTNFLSSSVVAFNGAALATTFVSATQLTATVPATALATAGSFAVTVTNPAPGGGASTGSTFVVTAAAPTIASFTPATGGPGTTVTITGTGFTGATAVTIGSFAVTNFTVVSATSITLVVPTGTGSVSGFITVTTPGGTATSVATFNLVSATLAGNALPELAVYPNPATDRITVELPRSGAVVVTLRDLMGRVVLAPAPLAANRQVLLPAGLATGVYLLEVRQGTAVAVRRIEKR